MLQAIFNLSNMDSLSGREGRGSTSYLAGDEDPALELVSVGTAPLGVELCLARPAPLHVGSQAGHGAVQWWQQRCRHCKHNQYYS